jgi:hypothetical protein
MGKRSEMRIYAAIISGAAASRKIIKSNRLKAINR